MFVLDARWTLGAQPGVTRHERITIPMNSMESPEIVVAMNRSLATLAERIVTQIGASPAR